MRPDLDKATSSTKRSPGLRELLLPVRPAAFIDHYWTKRHVVARGKPERLPALFGAPELQSLERVLDCPHAHVKAWLQDPRGGLSEVALDARQAAGLYEGGRATVIVDGLRHAVVSSLMAQMEVELGTPQPKIGCNVFVSPAGMGTRMHFDEQDVFLVQLHGRKRWKVAPMREAPYPPEGYMGAGVGPELGLIATRFATKMPKDAKTIVLRPGSVLYLPKGYWHASQTIESSIALTLTFPSSSMLDVVLASLRRRLLQRERWRQTASGVLGHGHCQVESISRMQDLVEALGNELTSLSAIDLLLS
jgi:50S ribosomal protein L16 3-hydroxylase